MHKRGVSDTVTTVLFVILVLVLIAILWYFIKPLIYSNEELTTSGSCITTNIQPVTCSYLLNEGNAAIDSNLNGSFQRLYYVNAFRQPGEGDVTSMRFIFENINGERLIFDWNMTLDPAGRESFKSSILPEELEYIKNTFIAFDSLGQQNFAPVHVSIAPQISGSRSYCSPVAEPVSCHIATVPNLPLDLDNDGDFANGQILDETVDINDLLYFLEAFAVDHPSADIYPYPEGDGAVTPEDLDGALGGFQTGCTVDKYPNCF